MLTVTLILLAIGKARLEPISQIRKKNARPDHSVGHPSDLLILDLAMPDLNGFKVCRSVKANPATRGSKILVLAESSQKDEVSEALASGADDHLTRSLQAEELRQKVQSLKQP